MTEANRSHLAAVARAAQRHRAATERAFKTRIELRDTIARARDAGETLQQIGKVLGITRQGVYDLLNR